MDERSATEPQPRERNRGADLFVAVLKSLGVRQVMALTGGAIMEGLDAVYSDSEIRTHFFQSEAGAVWSAMGYSRTTGKVGVCVVTSGPGATNTITGIADAHRDNVPLLVVTGQVPTTARNTDAFQETNITEIAAPTTKAVYYLSRVEDIISTLTEAFSTACNGRPGPVLIDFTKDAQQAPVGEKQLEEALTRRPETPSEGDSLPQRELEEAARLLQESRRPVLVLGYGAVLAGIEDELGEPADAIRRLAATLGAGTAGAEELARRLRMSNAERGRLCRLVAPDLAPTPGMPHERTTDDEAVERVQTSKDRAPKNVRNS